LVAARDLQSAHELAKVIGVMPHAVSTDAAAPLCQQPSARRGRVSPSGRHAGTPEVPRAAKRVRKKNAQLKPAAFERRDAFARGAADLDDAVRSDVRVFV